MCPDAARTHSVPFPRLPHTAPALAVVLAVPPPWAHRDPQLQLAATSLVAAPAVVAAARTATTTAASVLTLTLNTISLSAEVAISAPLSL